MCIELPGVGREIAFWLFSNYLVNIVCESRGWHTFPVKDQIVNILGFIEQQTKECRCSFLPQIYGA